MLSDELLTYRPYIALRIPSRQPRARVHVLTFVHMILAFRLFITLAVLWLVLSGLFKPQLLILGLISVIGVVWLSTFMRVLQHRGEPVYIRFLHIAAYWVWLSKQIFLSNVDVTRRVFARKLVIKPALRRITETPDTETGRVIYANSITLTPGTTAINFTPNGDIVVHALHEDSLRELEDGEMAAHVRNVEPHIKRTDSPDGAIR